MSYELENLSGMFPEKLLSIAGGYLVPASNGFCYTGSTGGICLSCIVCGTRSVINDRVSLGSTEYKETEYMETKKALQSAVLSSAPSGTRTLDTLIKSQVLYQLS